MRTCKRLMAVVALLLVGGCAHSYQPQQASVAPAGSQGVAQRRHPLLDHQYRHRQRVQLRLRVLHPVGFRGVEARSVLSILPLWLEVHERRDDEVGLVAGSSLRSATTAVRQQSAEPRERHARA